MNRVLVAGGGGDNAASAVGMGIIAPGQAFLSLGTSGVLFAVTDRFRPNPERAAHAFCHALPGRWHQMAVLLSAAGALDWVAQLLGATDLPQLVEAAQARRLRAESPYFLPYLSGERTPHNDPHARGVFFGLTHETVPADLVGAVLEGVALAFADGLDVLLESGGHIDEISMTGGGARLPYWGELLAAVLNRPLTYRAGSEIGAALGAARLGRMAATGEAPAAVCRLPPVLRVVEPDPRLAAMLAQRRGHFVRLYRDLRSTFQESASMSIFSSIDPIRFEGPATANEFAYRVYDKDRMVLGKRMEEWLKVAVCYWHSFNWPGADIFGGGTLTRPWLGPSVTQAMAEEKLDAAFDFISRLGVPYFTFHDVDVMATATTIKDHNSNLQRIEEGIAKKMAATGIKLLWGTANVFSHPRYAGGASTSPNPEVFAWAAAQVRAALDATQRLGGRELCVVGRP